MIKFEELFYSAMRELKNGDLNAAYQYLMDSIRDIKENVKEIANLSVHYNLNNNERPFLMYQQNGMSTPVDVNHLETVYYKSGEIAAKLGKPDDALNHFQDYQKMVMYNFNGDKIDKHLFSFRSFSEHSLFDLSNNTLSISRPKVMNDPFDTPIIEWGKYQLLHNKKTHSEQFLKSFSGYRIRSFSISKNKKLPINNSLMWAHYADGHKGFCVEYDFSSEFRKSLISFNRVHYDKVDLSKDKLSITEAFATKSKEWKYENEVRLIYYNCDSNEDYLTIPLDNLSSISAIYFGLKCSDERISIIRPLLEGKNVKFYKMEAKGSEIPYKLKPIMIK